MNRAFIYLLAATVQSVVAAEYFVSTNGVDLTGDGLSWETAWRTIGKAESSVPNGSTVTIGPGDFAEYVQVAGVTNVTFKSDSNAITRAFRIDTPSNIFSGITMKWACDAGGKTWRSFLYVNVGADHTVVTNCNIINSPWAEATNWFFDSATDTISSPGADFLTAGFADGCIVWWGGVSYTNGTDESVLRFKNQCQSGAVLTVGTTNLTFADGVLEDGETNTSAWSIIQAGSSPYEMYGIRFIVSAGNYPTNCVISGCLFSNMFGTPILLVGSDNAVTNCEFARILGGKAMTFSGARTLIASNYFHDCLAMVYYSQYDHDADRVSHEVGSGYYDYIASFIVGNNNTAIDTNTWIIGNWFENIEQPSIDLGRPVIEENNAEDIHVIGNVFIGVAGHLESLRNYSTIQSNTFFRCSYQDGKRYAFSGGGSIASPVSNVVVSHNLYVSCGDHSSPYDEGYAKIDWSTVSDPIAVENNYVAGAELLNWNSMSGWSNSWGINGGDPQFVNHWNPRGTDGIPFTADDGLRLRPYSPASGKGALGVSTNVNLLPCFSISGTWSNWLEPVGSNYNVYWQTGLVSFQRSSWDKGWDLPDPITNLPNTLLLDASNSISGTWSTNDWVGITMFVWDFGDGSAPVWTRWPDVRHTFLITGATEITLTATNSSGASSSYSRKYRILPGTNFSGDIFYVATNGNDTTGDGSYGLPLATATNAIKLAGPGDVICLQNGIGLTSFKMATGTAVDGTEENPISLCSLGAHAENLTNNLDYWTFEGIDFPGTNAIQYMYFGSAQIGTVIRNCAFHDGIWNLQGITISGSTLSRSRDLTVQNNRFVDIHGNDGNTVIQHVSNMTYDANMIIGCGNQPDTRIDGINVTISRNYGYHWSSNYHADFFAWISPGISYPFGNYVVERNWMEMIPATDQYETNDQTQIANAGIATGDVNELMTNFTFRNNVFINSCIGVNPITGDGISFHNNLFADSGWNDSSHFITYGTKAESCFDMDIRNNVFFRTGLTTNQGWYMNGCAYPSPTYQTNTSIKAIDFNFICHSNYLAKNPWYNGMATNNFNLAWGIPFTPSNALFGLIPDFDLQGQETNGINGGNPLFVDADAHDYRLSSTNSPLYAAATNLSAMFTTDFWGKTRPASGHWTMGPFEAFTGEAEATLATNRVQVQLRGTQTWRGNVRFQ